MNKHGELSTDGHVRYCDEHIVHGNLHNCPSYPKKVREKIEQEAEQFRKSVKDKTLKITMNIADFDNQLEHYYSLGFKDGLLHKLEKSQ